MTLIELIIFIIVVSVGLMGVLAVMNATAKSSADPVIRKQALSVAEAMMDEILSKDFQNDSTGDNTATPTLGCTPSTTPRCRLNTVLDRQNYNDVDDYDTWAQTGVFQLDGSLAPVLGNYTVGVSVLPMTLNAVAGKQVTVTVVGGTETVTLNGFRANF